MWIRVTVFTASIETQKFEIFFGKFFGFIDTPKPVDITSSQKN